MTVSRELLEEIALREEEYRLIVERLGREPNPLELGMFGALWSEHCGYKHSRPLLRLLPSDSPRLLVSPGEENAGAVDIGHGLAVVMKMESHNHPSAVEPYQGAATGVGGIVRDILAMGARPVALLNSLRFGPLSEPRNRYLFNGVVGGISWYGNCLGIPDVGGEVFFSPAYTHNPLVNVMCVGLVEKDKLVTAKARGPGNLLLLIGGETGRDGIHGASGLASRPLSQEGGLRPAVQVGNPFLEKVLMEACLELAPSPAIVGIQDLGAGGLAVAAVESAARAGTGVEIDVSRVFRREEGMTPYEVLLSESQERMLLIVRKGMEHKVKAVLQKWDLPSAVVGKVIDEDVVLVRDGEEKVAELPIPVLTRPPLYRLTGVRSRQREELQRANLEGLPLPQEEPAAILLRLLSSVNIASKEWIYRQYDHQVGINTVVAPGADAAVLRVKGTRKGLALTSDGNGRYTYLDPFMGGAIAVAEACRNLVCVGAEPVALTNCLNFGNPEKPEVYYELEECIQGMAAACRALGVPIISGNVSLYNESQGKDIYPTPIVGGLGLLEEVTRYVTPGFREEGDVVVLLGAREVLGEAAALGGSEYLEVVHAMVAGRPRVDLELEKRVQGLCLRGIRSGLFRSAHDCSDGGLAVALAEACIAGGRGFRGEFEVRGRWDAALFGEAQSRILVSLQASDLPDLERLAAVDGVPWVRVGVVEGRAFSLPRLLELPLPRISEAWQQGLERALIPKPPL